MSEYRQVDVAIVGAGPAGLSAAESAATHGRSVLLIDDNQRTGGQIWRHPTAHNLPSGNLADVLSNIDFAGNTRAFAWRAPNILDAETNGRALRIECKALILATGARERCLPFPGWTLPNVMGAGGLQAMAKGGLDISGKRVVVAGTGSLLMAVAAYLRQKGADLACVVEQAPTGRLIGMLGPLFDTAKIGQAAALGFRLLGTPYYRNAYIARAEGESAVRRVLMRRGGKERWIDCEYLAIGYDIVPNLELAQAIGCNVANGAVEVDLWQRTSVPDVYAAGEVTGIGGIDKAISEGHMAGLAALGHGKEARSYREARAKSLQFADALRRVFALRTEVTQLADEETIICRCEDVRLKDLAPYSCWREAKLQTRCGMGPCQGRICGPILQAIKGWEPGSVRPPVTAVRVGSILDSMKETEE